MAISDTKLRTIYGKPYSGPQEVADADGLSVRISPKGVIQFQYRYRWHGKPNRLGLGRYPSLSLKDARQITADLRKLYFSGTDPRTYFEEKVDNSMTVAQCLDYWFDNYVSMKWFTEFGHLNRGDMLTSEQHRCHNEKKKFQRRV